MISLRVGFVALAFLFVAPFPAIVARNGRFVAAATFDRRGNGDRQTAVGLRSKRTQRRCISCDGRNAQSTACSRGRNIAHKALKISASDVRVGDRVLVPGGAAGKQTATAQIIVMARVARDEKHERIGVAAEVSARLLRLMPGSRRSPSKFVRVRRAGNYGRIDRRARRRRFRRFAPIVRHGDALASRVRRDKGRRPASRAWKLAAR